MINQHCTETWMARNCLTINAEKTNILFFGRHHTLSNIERPNVQSIEIIDTYKYLGIVLDSKFTFTQHVNYVRQKAISWLKMMGETRPMINIPTVLTLYKTIVTHLFDYNDVVFDCLSAEDSERLHECRTGSYV